MPQTITIKAMPRAKQNKVGEWKNNMLRVYVTAPPVGGKANKAIIQLLSNAWAVPQSQIRIIRGETSRKKVLEIPDGVTLQKQLI